MLAVPAVACLAVVGYKMRVLPGTAAVPRITNLLELERKENIKKKKNKTIGRMEQRGLLAYHTHTLGTWHASLHHI